MFKILKNVIFPILVAGIWINISEFVRNEILIKQEWVEHYQKLQLVFPSEPANGIIWLIWGFSFSIFIFIISKKFNLFQTTAISWFVAFFMMWLVIWNLDVLPLNILGFAVPLSLLESFLASLIIKKLTMQQTGR
jgi:hypothetical protein